MKTNQEHHHCEIEADERWARVLARDPEADGTFVYSVSTTGIYCRPSCGARRPLPRHVAFHENSAAAEAAGFRPCRRCRPEGFGPREAWGASVERACRTMETAETMPTLATLAEAAGMSPWHFQRIFKSTTGLTPKGYGHAVRAERVRAGLHGGAAVTAALFDAGYNGTGRFYADSGEALGMTPTTYRAGGAGETIQYACARCALGQVLAAWSALGVCAILMGDSEAELEAELAERFPRATRERADQALSDRIRAVVALVEEPVRGLDLPLDIRGTAFQRRVWEALRALPAGTKATYTEIAEAIGAPKSVRAVAGACAANALAVAIPCHRVVRSDGGLSGYRWGVERKRALLDSEGAK